MWKTHLWILSIKSYTKAIVRYTKFYFLIGELFHGDRFAMRPKILDLKYAGIDRLFQDVKIPNKNIPLG